MLENFPQLPKQNLIKLRVSQLRQGKMMTDVLQLQSCEREREWEWEWRRVSLES